MKNNHLMSSMSGSEVKMDTAIASLLPTSNVILSGSEGSYAKILRCRSE